VDRRGSARRRSLELREIVGADLEHPGGLPCPQHIGVAGEELVERAGQAIERPGVDHRAILDEVRELGELGEPEARGVAFERVHHAPHPGLIAGGDRAARAVEQRAKIADERVERLALAQDADQHAVVRGLALRRLERGDVGDREQHAVDRAIAAPDHPALGRQAPEVRADRPPRQLIEHQLLGQDVVEQQIELEHELDAPARRQPERLGERGAGHVGATTPSRQVRSG